MDHIDEHLATAALNADYPMAIKAALAIGKTTLNRYYNKTDHSEIFRIAMSMFFFQLHSHISNQTLLLVLHPQHKHEYFEAAGWEAAWVEEAKEIVRTEYERSYKYRDTDTLSDLGVESDSTTKVRLSQSSFFTDKTHPKKYRTRRLLTKKQHQRQRTFSMTYQHLKRRTIKTQNCEMSWTSF
jgi:hypothetical protein